MERFFNLDYGALAIARVVLHGYAIAACLAAAAFADAPEQLAAGSTEWSILEAHDGSTVACDSKDLLAADRFDSWTVKLTSEEIGGLIDGFATIFGIDLAQGLDFAFVGGGQTLNARASGSISTRNAIRPSRLCIGRGLIGAAMKVDDDAWDTALAGIIAHEFAHILQMRDDTDSLLLARDPAASVRLLELHADFLAGWALGQAYWLEEIHQIRGALRQFQAIGDQLAGQRAHHGDPAQRRSAVASGLGYGLISERDPAAAVAEGIAFLERQFDDLAVSPAAEIEKKE